VGQHRIEYAPLGLEDNVAHFVSLAPIAADR
jgi:hypothetical protein